MIPINSLFTEKEKDKKKSREKVNGLERRYKICCRLLGGGGGVRGVLNCELPDACAYYFRSLYCVEFWLSAPH